MNTDKIIKLIKTYTSSNGKLLCSRIERYRYAGIIIGTVLDVLIFFYSPIGAVIGVSLIFLGAKLGKFLGVCLVLREKRMTCDSLSVLDHALRKLGVPQENLGLAKRYIMKQNLEDAVAFQDLELLNEILPDFIYSTTNEETF